MRGQPPVRRPRQRPSLPRLAPPRARHRPGTSEIRLWLDRGLETPHHVVRLSRSPDETTGEIVAWWPKQLRRAPQITRLGSDEAAKFFDELTALGVWTLEKPPEPEADENGFI